MKPQHRLPFLSFLLAGTLSACGGGISFSAFDDDVDDFDFHPTFSSGRRASVTLASSDARFDGVYFSNDLRLSDVLRFFPGGGEPQTCRFRFAGLQQESGERVMDGEIRYLVAGNEVRATIVMINTLEFRLDGGARATVDRGKGAIVYDGAVLTSTQGTGQTVTLTGSIPMRDDRPAGC